MRHTAQKKPLGAAQSPRTHNNKLGAELLGGVDNALRHVPFPEDRLHGTPDILESLRFTSREILSLSPQGDLDR